MAADALRHRLRPHRRQPVLRPAPGRTDRVRPGLSPAAAGLLVTLTQIGYGLGLLFIVPLGDILENRKLVLTLLVCCALALASASIVRNAPVFLAAAAAIGFTSVTVQILVPWSAHLASEANRGRVVGNGMSGLLMGIMLARPVASFVASILQTGDMAARSASWRWSW